MNQENYFLRGRAFGHHSSFIISGISERSGLKIHAIIQRPL